MEKPITSSPKTFTIKLFSIGLLCWLLMGTALNSRANDPVVRYTSPKSVFINKPTTITPKSRNVHAVAYSAIVKKLPVGQLTPKGIVTDTAGDVYVADAATQSILLYPADGSKPFKLAGNTPGLGGLAYHRVISGGSVNEIIYAISGNSVFQYDRSLYNTFTVKSTVTSTLSSPKGIATDKHGNAYVCNTQANTVTEYSPAGGSKKIGFNFSLPNGVAVDSAGNVYVSDAGNNRIRKVSAIDGTIQTIASITNPVSLTMDAANNIYVSNSGGKLFKIPADGSAVVTMLTGAYPISAMNIDPHGVLYTASSARDNVNVYTPVGGFYLNISLPTGMDFDESTGVISGKPTEISKSRDYKVTGYNATGNASAIINLEVVSNPTFLSYSSPQKLIINKQVSLVPQNNNVDAYGYSEIPSSKIGSGLNAPYSTKVDSLGDLYVCDSRNNRVIEYPTGGGTPVIRGTGFTLPGQLALDAAGNIYVTSGDSTLKKIAAHSNTTTTLLSGLASPAGVGVDKYGVIYVCLYGKDEVLKIPPGGGASKKLSGTFRNPDGLCLDKEGNVYVANLNNNSITETFANDGHTAVIGYATRAEAIAVDAAGNVYVSGVDSYPALFEIPLNSGTAINLFNKTVITGIAIDSKGVLYLSNFYDPSIEVYKPLGGFFLNKPLPQGLIFSQKTGIIRGVPTALAPAQDYTVTAYNSSYSSSATVNIAVVPDSAVVLATLSADPASVFKPDSAVGNTYYRSTSVDPATTSIALTPTTNQPDAVITIGSQTVASGATSSAIALNASTPTIINVVVTAADNSSTKTYVITINKNGSSNAILTDLRIKAEPALTQVKNSALTDYLSLTMAHRASSVVVIATASDPAATIKINSTTVTSGAESGPIPIFEGTNTITAVVTAADGVTVKTYIITVIKDNESLASLESPDETTDNLTVHTAVTPNGNGVNDFLKIDGIEAYPDNKLQVINTGGSKVFEATGYNNQTKVFDGHSSVNGSKQNAGTYFYVLQYKAKGVSKTKSGYLILKY